MPLILSMYIIKEQQKTQNDKVINIANIFPTLLINTIAFPIVNILCTYKGFFFYILLASAYLLLVIIMLSNFVKVFNHKKKL